MTARQNVEFPLRMRGHGMSARRKLATEMLAKVGLEGMSERQPREMSGGQQQRVALARALVFQPDALLLDEPLGALDKNLRERMQAEIKELQRKTGISILFVTHDQEEAMTMSDRIAVMDGGRIVQIGAPQDVYYHPVTPFVAGVLWGNEPAHLPRARCRTALRYGDARRWGHRDSAGSAAGRKGRYGPSRLALGPPRADQGDAADRDGFCGGCDRHRADLSWAAFSGYRRRRRTSAWPCLSSDLELMRSIVVGMEITLGWMRDDAQILDHADA